MFFINEKLGHKNYLCLSVDIKQPRLIERRQEPSGS